MKIEIKPQEAAYGMSLKVGKFKVDAESLARNRYGNFCRFDEISVEDRRDRVHIEANFKSGTMIAAISLTPEDAVKLHAVLGAIIALKSQPEAAV